MTFARRQGSRFNRGRVASAEGGGGAASLLSLLTIVTSRTCQYLLIGDLGYASSGGTTTWTDQSGLGNHFAIADASAPVATVYSEINGKTAILGNGSSQYLESTLNGADQWWYLFVTLPVSWTAGDSITDSTGSANRQRICQNPTNSPNWRQQATANGTTVEQGAEGTWWRMRAHWTGDAATYLRIGGVQQTSNIVSTPNLGRRLFATGGAVAGFYNGAIALAAVWDDEPSAGEMGEIDALITSYYGAAVTVG